MRVEEIISFSSSKLDLLKCFGFSGFRASSSSSYASVWKCSVSKH